MHLINRALSLLNCQVVKTNKNKKKASKMSNDEREFSQKYEYYCKQVENNARGFRAFKDYRYEAGEHPYGQNERVSEFAAFHLYKEKPGKVLDIGSFRQFLLGLLAHYDVTTIDIRGRESLFSNENIITCDAKALDLPDNSFDTVMCMASVYIFGLGRYGDEFDLDADIKAFKEMIRVLKPGGLLIFSTSIGAAPPSIYFSRCKIYNYEMIHSFCSGLDCVDERFSSRKLNRYCSYDELITDPHSDFYDNYLGCWRKR